ncbi:class I SAM-dependent methyltransferase [Chitinophaga vietnamensis]|uniref:class I SAM-dependent methyltransferase n=1 Tax=Chitinophaga vietnamensis TaxID=2593957 RepID=UPI001177D65B|nr:class I SAM-dependent methyltransferase [Chitinophaga vietnamensis]
MERSVNMQQIRSIPAWYANDASFDWLYAEHLQRLSKQHWTPMEIARKSAHFLAGGQGKRILDIGSGIGKFCLIGAYYHPEAQFFGVEQRPDLHQAAISAKSATGVSNAYFKQGDFAHLHFPDYDHFYFYNAFFEHIATEGHIDQQPTFSATLYHHYSRRLFQALDSKPGGTRLVTFHSLEDEVPPSYQLVDASVDFLLKMWIKREERYIHG